MSITHAQVAIRLAGEEVPVRVIARSLQTPADEIRDILHDAVANGRIIRVPRDDWHPHPRGQQAPVSITAKMEDEDLVLNCKRRFKVTGLQASFLALLIKKNEVRKDTLHQRVEARRSAGKNEATDPKIVDVVICNLRKKVGLKTEWKFDIKTLWGSGYYMEPESRERAQKAIAEFMESLDGEPDTGREDDAGPAAIAGDDSDQPESPARGDAGAG